MCVSFRSRPPFGHDGRRRVVQDDNDGAPVSTFSVWQYGFDLPL
jgi:hypothetical protein